MEAERWHEHTSYTNRAGAVFQKVKSEVCPELLTQVIKKLLSVNFSIYTLFNHVFLGLAQIL